MSRFQFSPALVLSTVVALVAIVAVTVAGWLAITNLTDESDADAEALAATVAIARHSSDLMATGAVASNATMSRDSVLADRATIARLKSALAEQVAVVEGSGSDATAIAARVNSLISTVEQIDAGRPDLLLALLSGEQSFQKLVVTNNRSLFPALATSIDDHVAFMLTGESEARGSAVPASEARSAREVRHFWHLSALQRDVSLGHTILGVASLLQNPTRVARSQEGFDSVAQRMARSLEYLAEHGSPELDPQIVPLAHDLREAGSGETSLFVDLAARLELVVREQALIADSEAHHAALLADLDAFAGQVRDGGTADEASTGQVTLLIIAVLGVVATLLVGAYAARRAA